MKTLTDFIKKPKPSLITCHNCQAIYSEKLGYCPKCKLRVETPEEIENWREI